MTICGIDDANCLRSGTAAAVASRACRLRSNELARIGPDSLRCRPLAIGATCLPGFPCAVSEMRCNDVRRAGRSVAPHVVRSERPQIVGRHAALGAVLSSDRTRRSSGGIGPRRAEGGEVRITRGLPIMRASHRYRQPGPRAWALYLHYASRHRGSRRRGA